MNKRVSLIQEFQYIVTYHIEFGYDPAAISPEANNVSQSPGFEAVWGIPC